MPKLTVKLMGEKKLLEKLRQLGEAAADALEEAAEAGADIVLEDAKARVPVRTGTLKESLTKETTEKTAGRAVVSVGPGKEGFYGRFVELGTSKTAPRPFLRPALDKNRRGVKAAVGDRVKAALEKVVR